MQLVEILSHSNKIKTIDDLLNHFDLVVELARDDIYPNNSIRFKIESPKWL